MTDAMKSVVIGLFRQGNKPERIAFTLHLHVDDVKKVLLEYKFSDDWKLNKN